MRKQIFWAMGKSRRGFGLEVIRKPKLKKKFLNQKTVVLLKVTVPNFCIVIVTIFFNIIIITIIILINILIFLLPTYFSLDDKSAKLQNSMNILFCISERSKIMRKQRARSHFVYFISYFEWNGPKKNSLKRVKRCVRVVLVTSNNILLVYKFSFFYYIFLKF